MKTLLLFILCSVFAVQRSITAQETIVKDAPVVYGHYHLYVPDIEAHKKFWGETLGGSATKLKSSPIDIVRISHVIITLSQRAAPTQRQNTAVNHIALQVPDVLAAVTKVKAAGYPITTKTELPASAKVTGDTSVNPEIGETVAFVQGPDNVKVELVESRGAATPVPLDHIHFIAQDPEAMSAWYVKTFGAKPAAGASVVTAVLPRVKLLFSRASGPIAPTKGEIVDHIGFEIRDLEKFTKSAQAAGTKLDRPYGFFAAADMGFAFVTDPFGTQIELTEGLP